MSRSRRPCFGTIGIVGGGQLAGMLVEAAHHLGFPTAILSDSPRDPALRMNPFGPFPVQWFDARRADDQNRFLKLSEVVLIESEWAPQDLLARATKTVPSLAALGILSNKFEQKRLLKKLGVPTADFIHCDETDDEGFLKWLQSAHQTLGPAVMLKLDQFGYDGKGNYLATARRPQAALAFFRLAQSKHTRLYAEACIPFESEAALISVVPDPTNSRAIIHYPMVWTRQRDGICDVVQGPASKLGLSRSAEQLARRAARAIARTLHLQGTFAIEWFVLNNGRTLLVNEIAPRVHNSGHFTQDHAMCSQFENHLRAALGISLGSTRTTAEFGMVNWIGTRTRTHQRPPEHWHAQTLRAGGHAHFYFKDREKPGRKMGHSNFDSWKALGYFLKTRTHA